jgi:hypothetical protein
VIPEVLVNDCLKLARRHARATAERIHAETGCHTVTVVAEIDGGRACTSMAVDPSLEHEPEAEVALMKCALARVLSLLVLHLGRGAALVAAMEAVGQGAELARLATEESDDAPR